MGTIRDGSHCSARKIRFVCMTLIEVATLLSTDFAAPDVAWASGARAGLSATDVMRTMALWTSVLAIALLVVTEFVLRQRISHGAYHWLLLMGLLVFPYFSMTATSAVLLEQSKTVNSCASCHSMSPFVNDMRDPASTTLAARHYLNKWIPRDQCYECHTTYGIHGTIEAKQQGLEHWWRYVTNNWQRPIPFIGKYPDADCLKCHDGTPAYENAQAHQAAFKALASGEVDCIFCHGPPHPSAEQRSKLPGAGQNELIQGGPNGGESGRKHNPTKPSVPKAQSSQ
jgi:cytochrome c nitrite reductase small subunit